MFQKMFMYLIKTNNFANTTSECQKQIIYPLL